jgi:N-methylhydantoinase A
MNPEVRIGIDIGGTFTDFVVFMPSTGQLHTFKIPTSTQDPSQSVLEGLTRILNLKEAKNYKDLTIVHGSTVATNALLEHKGAKTALIATHGFKDVIQIGRQNRPSLYDFFCDPPVPLIPEEFRYEVVERIDAQGNVLIPLSEQDIDEIIPLLDQNSIESVAICLLFSFLHPAHELKIAQKLRQKGLFVSASCEILPEYREYERTSTTTINAYVSPILDRYLSQLEENISRLSNKSSRLRIMQSNGGQISLNEARINGVRCILSGPAGGVVGCQYIAQFASKSVPANKLITFDMGGTSTDVSLIDHEPKITKEAHIGGYPISIPMLDIHTIGAGGGSIAYVDSGGALRVGPISAGAYPGPACYGNVKAEQAQPTVTDANLVLGRLIPEMFLGGQIRLNPDLAIRAIAQLSQKLGLDIIRTALGIIEIVNTHMMRALRVISVERGYDPMDFSLLAFGGAGGLHAVSLARQLGIPRVVIPPIAATLSAFGMLVADVIKDYSQTVMFSNLTPIATIKEALIPLTQRATKELQEEGISPEQVIIEQILDMRYKGQSYELPVPFRENPWDEFHAIHQKAYGYSHPDAPMEIVNLRVRALGKIPPIPIRYSENLTSDATHARIGKQRLYLSQDEIEVPLYRGEMLKPGNRIHGPALIARDDTTILLEPTNISKVDHYLNLIISI